MTEKERYLPLIAFAIEPVALVIFDNKLIGLEDIGSDEQYPYNPYQVLHQLYKQEVTRKAIPTRFHKYFENQLGAVRQIIPFLIGEHEYVTCFHCLHVEVEIEKGEQPVIVKKGMMVNDYPWQEQVEIAPIAGQVRLTAKEAFSVFANICTSSFMTRFGYHLLSKKEQTFNPEELREVIKGQYGGKDTMFAKLQYHIQHFAVEYLEYLLEEIQQNKITLEEVLWRNGMGVLVMLINEPKIYQYFEEVKQALIERYQELSFNQKLLYYCLIWVSLNADHYREKAREFYRKYSKENKEMERELLKKFPESDGQKQENK